ncbi:hypothetical protein OG21DRAFT_1526737 [Imleria badia]|nr:hypothetical protein OG21DRAFT_1526916 [Imleria badia]KAF8548074.1 hypothetical protein OG21DRAFT_1526737 [Imleria badia]
MSQNHPDSDNNTAVEFLLDVPQESWRHRLYANLRAFLSRLFALACVPRRFAPLVIDYWLLVRSIWGTKQLGPDLVYPMLSIRKRQSGRLAGLILGHCRTVRQYELRAAAPFPEGIDPPCVAVLDLDDAPRDIAENGYSTHVDFYGFVCMLMLVEATITLVLHAFYLFDQGLASLLNWIICAVLNLVACLGAVARGNGTLTLARRSYISTPGCTVLLDQDFTVVLTGDQSVVEAIAESSFNLSHPNKLVWIPNFVKKLHHGPGDGRYSAFTLLKALCEGVCLAVLVLFWLVFCPSTFGSKILLLDIVIPIIACLLPMFPPNRISLRRRVLCAAIGLPVRLLPPTLFITIYLQPTEGFSLAFLWHLLPIFLGAFFYVGYKAQNYPIRLAKFLDALGHPQVRKWQFDTLAAAATFQCLVLCRDIPRPIRTIDVLALLDLLIPDQRDLWNAWKARVADRIVHETDILFTPTIPTFGDKRQQQLRDLLDQAQIGYDTYRRFYVHRVPLLPVT